MSKIFNILITDDSDLMRMVMKAFFSKLLPSSQVTETANLQDTYEVLSQNEFDLLMLDINMPNGDSNPNTVREFKAKYPDLKICMFSGNDKKTLEAEYLQAGAIGFIQKDQNLASTAEEIITKLFLS